MTRTRACRTGISLSFPDMSVLETHCSIKDPGRFFFHPEGT